MKLPEAQKLAVYLMEKHGRGHWRFEFDNARRRFGCCSHWNKTIRLSKALTLLNSEDEVKDVILHEIAHALIGANHGHDYEWKMKAREVGARPERCYDNDKVTQPESKYIAVCKGCGVTHKRHKRHREGKTSSCGKCSGGTYNPTFKLDYIINPKYLVVSI